MELIPGGIASSVEWQETGLAIPEGTPFDDWLALGETLKRIERASQWWIGDWLNFGEHSYGEKYAQALEETDKTYQTLADYKWVAGKIQLSRRRENVSFSTHREIAALQNDEQIDQALARAEKERWSKRDARKNVNEIKALGNKSASIDPPSGKYRCIVIDPPWPMQKIELEVRPEQRHMDYPVMSEEAILEITLPSDEHCHVFCWTTQRFLPLSFRCLEGWGARYVCTFVWHKPGGPQPLGLPQYNAEFVLYGRIGTPKFVNTKQFFTAFNAARGAHSEKPGAFYDMIRNATDGPRIDMFARRRIEGFDAWGNEA